MRVIIVGGAKTGYNLYKYFISQNVHAELYYLPGDYSEKRNVGKSFDDNWPGMEFYARDFEKNEVVISSERAFVRLPEEDRHYFQKHYYLRNKANLDYIADKIGAEKIHDISKVENMIFPVAVKPKESGEKIVPFKFRIINSSSELDEIKEIADHCIIQSYLNPQEYSQIAVAGYFDGSSASLVTVQQKSHYPTGVSAFVVNRCGDHPDLVENITNFLNSMGFKGFIEFEFKYNTTNQIFHLMDINPRPWGWFYYYLDGINNFREFWVTNQNIDVDLKPMWVNTPRLLLAMVRGSFNSPSIIDVIKLRVCYEPYFK